jgi:SAM-dependent methyltransferase
VSWLAGLSAFFCEEFEPARGSAFDSELDAVVSAAALTSGKLTGYCNVSAQATEFSVSDPNLRENVFALGGGTGNRHRQLACALSQALFGTPLVSLPATAEVINARASRVFLTETTTPFHHALRALVRPELLVTSEYFGPEFESGADVDGVRHEDLQQTSFADDSFDLVITSDVLEHVADAPAAEREIVRILRPGGSYCYTVPMNPVAAEDAIRAVMRPDGSIEYLAEPMYHGDPLRSEGVLVFRIFSVTGMMERFAALGAVCRTYRLWSKHYGLIGPGCWIHIVRKL